MHNKLLFVLFLSILLVSSCKKIHHTEIVSFSNKEYPHNPDISYQSSEYNNVSYTNIRFIPEESPFHFSIELIDTRDKTHQLLLSDVDLREFIPFAPSWIKQDTYLTKIGLINQEWNRQQVQFFAKGKKVKVKGNEFEEANLSRIDIARNCLSSYKWEVILWSNEDNRLKPYYHGWFQFPENLYETLFEDRNELEFDNYETFMTEWTDPEEDIVDFKLLRSVKDTSKVNFKNLNNRLYPMVGERLHKSKNIISPASFERIDDLLTDSTSFATFTQEGRYNKDVPRTTELGRLAIVDSIWISEIRSPAVDKDKLHEMRIFYTHATDSIKTELVIGGIDFEILPKLLETESNKAWQNSMGIANHTFYDTYENTLNNSCEKSPYYALTTDQYQNWIDSHKIGIDGPLLFLDKRNPRVLHIFILSFERHAFVGHYTINLNQIQDAA